MVSFRAFYVEVTWVTVEHRQVARVLSELNTIRVDTNYRDRLAELPCRGLLRFARKKQSREFPRKSCRRVHEKKQSSQRA